MMKVLLILLSITALSQNAYATFFPRVATNLELEEYLGKWYQIASSNPVFQQDCYCVTAEYEVNDNGNVDVINSCRKGAVDGELDIAVGEARKTWNPAKFRVSFGGFRSPFSNYWVVSLADDYSYAVVSSPFRNPIWILSRTPEMDEETYEGIIQNLKSRYFDTSIISKTVQLGCDN